MVSLCVSFCGDRWSGKVQVVLFMGICTEIKAFLKHIEAQQKGIKSALRPFK